MGRSCALVRVGAAALIIAVTAGSGLADAAASRAPARRGLAQLEAALHATNIDRGLRIVLPADRLFGASRDMLDSAADPLLAQLAELIAAIRPSEIHVAGHTDSAGTDADNQTLSDQRAHAVTAWLDAHAPNDRPRFVEHGYGRTRPVAPNHTADGSNNPAGRERNRRVEITLLR
jgi:outer membrane protein OmpA-like peptidoglycan-associated protein